MRANENQLQIEILQPEISGQIQKITREELKNWIKDGKLKPNHQVRIKNLNWIEAHKIPAFQALFELKKNESTAQSNHLNNQNILNASILKFSKLKTDEAAVHSTKPPSSVSNVSPQNKPKPAEPSIPFKIFEKRNLARFKQIKSNNEQKVTVSVIKSSDAAEPAKYGNCFLHKDKPSKFVCANCTNYFCGECPVTIGNEDNCCPFCKLVCKSLDTEIKEAETQEKKKVNLLELGELKDFVVYDYPDEKRKKLGIIPAFVIAVLFSISISILWVYKVSAYLENRGKEISQNISADKKQEPKKNDAAKTAEQPVNQNAKTEANQPCIDPQTKQPFECDEQTRMVLRDHTEKVKSTEKAQKETAEKTNLVLGSLVSSSSPTSENAQQEIAKPNPADEARKELDKQRLIKVFIYSFLIIFGLQMSTRLFSKG